MLERCDTVRVMAHVLLASRLKSIGCQALSEEEAHPSSNTGSWDIFSLGEYGRMVSGSRCEGIEWMPVKVNLIFRGFHICVCVCVCVEGVIIWQLWYRKDSPWGGLGPLAILGKTMKGKRPPFSEPLPPTPLRALIEQMWSQVLWNCWVLHQIMVKNRERERGEQFMCIRYFVHVAYVWVVKLVKCTVVVSGLSIETVKSYSPSSLQRIHSATHRTSLIMGRPNDEGG